MPSYSISSFQSSGVYRSTFTIWYCYAIGGNPCTTYVYAYTESELLRKLDAGFGYPQ